MWAARTMTMRLVQGPGNKGYISKSKLREEAPPAPRQAGQPDALPWAPTGSQGTAFFWERTEAPLPPLRPRCNFIHPNKLSPFPERLELPFSSEEILSGLEDIVSSGTDQFTTWVKTDPHATLVRHMVDVQKTTADFREASERRHDTPSQTNSFNKSVSNRSPVQKRLSFVQLESRSPTRKRRCLRKSRSQAGGTSSLCKKHLSMSTMTFLLVGST